MKDLDRYVERIVTSQTRQEAFDHFCEAMRHYGHDLIAYSLVNNHLSLGLSSQHGLATSYPEDWMKRYAAHNFLLIDPVTRQVLTKRTRFFWSEVTSTLDRRSDDGRTCRRLAWRWDGHLVARRWRGAVRGWNRTIIIAGIGAEQAARLQFPGRRVSAQHMLA